MSDEATLTPGLGPTVDRERPDGALSGVFCPLVTPLRDGAPDERSATALARRTLDAGIDGLVVCGTTGEFASLADREYEAVLATVADCVRSHERTVPVVAGAADTNVRGVLDRIETAADAGADYALVPPPYFHGPNGPDGVERFYRSVLDRSRLPVILYNIPSCVGTEIAPDTVEALRTREDVRGLKDSSGDFRYALDVLPADSGAFSVLVGSDRYLLSGLLAGASGGVNGLSNVLPEAFSGLVGAVREGDLERARRIQVEQIDELSALCHRGYAPTIKAVLAELDVVERPDVRVPLTELTERERTDVAAAVRDLSG